MTMKILVVLATTINHYFYHQNFEGIKNNKSSRILICNLKNLLNINEVFIDIQAVDYLRGKGSFIQSDAKRS